MNTKKFLAKCAIASAATVVAVPGANANEKANEQAYFNSNYQFCDAKKIARVWNRDVYEGKLVIGAKIRAGLTNLADADIASTGRSVPCTYNEIGVTYDDAVKLAAYWGRTVPDAKAKAVALATDWGARAFLMRMSHVIG